MTESTSSTSERDPREELNETLREFLFSGVNIDVGDTAAGSVYKLDGGFLKILLAEPAADEVLYDEEYLRSQREAPRTEGEMQDRKLPLLWVSIVLSENTESSVEVESDAEDAPTRLEEAILGAEEIIVRKVPPEGLVEEMTSSKNRFVSKIPDYGTAAEALSYVPPSEEVQKKEASDLLETLSFYAHRSIKTT